MSSIAQAELEVVASFPVGYFLENLAIRANHSVLITVANKQELWYVPPVTTSLLPVEPSLMFTFEQVATAIVETDFFFFDMCTC